MSGLVSSWVQVPWFILMSVSNDDWFDIDLKHVWPEMLLKNSRYLFYWYEKTNRKTKKYYLNVFGKLIIGEDTERRKVPDRVELEDDLNGLSVARVITPSNPTYNGRIIKVKTTTRVEEEDDGDGGESKLVLCAYLYLDLGRSSWLWSYRDRVCRQSVDRVLGAVKSRPRCRHKKRRRIASRLLAGLPAASNSWQFPQTFIGENDNKMKH